MVTQEPLWLALASNHDHAIAPAAVNENLHL